MISGLPLRANPRNITPTVANITCEGTAEVSDSTECVFPDIITPSYMVIFSWVPSCPLPVTSSREVSRHISRWVMIQKNLLSFLLLLGYNDGIVAPKRPALTWSQPLLNKVQPTIGAIAMPHSRESMRINTVADPKRHIRNVLLRTAFTFNQLGTRICTFGITKCGMLRPSTIGKIDKCSAPKPVPRS